MDSYSSSHVDFLSNWFVDNTKFLVDVDTAVVAAEGDATARLITDVSNGAANGKTFRRGGQQLAIRQFWWPQPRVKGRLGLS